MKPDMVALEQARWGIGKIWFICSGLLFAVLIVQSLANVYEDRVQAVWGWFLPNIMPTLSLMLGVFAAAALQEHVESDDMRVRKNFYRLATMLSLFHLAAVAGTIAAQPMLATLAGSNAKPMALFDVSNIFLGPLQGVVAAAIGAMFFSKASKDTTDANAQQNQGGG